MKKLLFILAIVFLSTSLSAQANSKNIETPFQYKIHGWTNDSASWAYSEDGDYGCGMVYQPGTGSYIIDATKNKFSFKFFKTTDFINDEDKMKADKQVEGWRNDNLKRLQKNGFSNIMGTVVYQKPKGSWVDYDSVMKLNGEKTVTFKHNNDKFIVDPTKILKSDDPFWKDFVDYGIVYISISPDNKKIAILIEAVSPGPEGVKESRFLGITERLMWHP